ncbi:hypothetical protein Dip518_000509 [Parelusimicrobium proximum]|uniref:hypothetical protein n=1 Tax=Parelusimicrobium proximum TaxID=3228953 RepID=UPI003D1698EB
MYKGTLEIAGKKINVTVDAIDKGVDTYFKGSSEEDVPEGKGGTMHLATDTGHKFDLKDCVIEKGGKKFEGYGKE